MTVTASRNTSGLGGSDYLGAGLGTYSALTDSFYAAAGVNSASRFGIRYGLPALLSDIPGGVAGTIGVFQAYGAYTTGDYSGAVQASGGTLGGIAGAEGGAFIGGLFGPAAFITVPIGAVAGGVYGAYMGSSVAGSIYNIGFEPLDQPGPNTPSIFPYYSSGTVEEVR